MDGSIERRIERLEESTPDEPSGLTELLMKIGSYTAQDFEGKPTMQRVLDRLRESRGFRTYYGIPVLSELRGYRGQREIDKGRQN